MKHNFVAKNAPRSGSGFHTDAAKPENDKSCITVICRTCGEYSDVDKNEYDCPQCGSNNIIEIEGLS